MEKRFKGIMRHRDVVKKRLLYVLRAITTGQKTKEGCLLSPKESAQVRKSLQALEQHGPISLGDVIAELDR